MMTMISPAFDPNWNAEIQVSALQKFLLKKRQYFSTHSERA